MLASILRSEGYKVGLYTSPHLIRFNERITINGKSILDDDIASFIEKKRMDIDRIRSTFFETTTVMALDYFVQKKVDIAIIEVGLGGRLDSTNIILPKVAAITPISLDHKHILGKDILSITKEKSGIIKKDIPLVLSNQDLEAEQYIIKVANKMNSPINKIGDINNIHLSPLGTKFNYKSGTYSTPLLGFHQAQNAATSIEIAKTYNNKIKNQTIQKGLTNTKWYGRMQKISSNLPIYYDVAHNAKGVEAMIDTITSIYKTIPHIVLSLKGDKEIALIAKALMNNFESLIITGSDEFDLMEANDLYKYFIKKPCQANIEKVQSIDKSFDLLITKVEKSHNPGIIMGSHYMAKSVFDKFGIFT